MISPITVSGTARASSLDGDQRSATVRRMRGLTIAAAVLLGCASEDDDGGDDFVGTASSVTGSESSAEESSSDGESTGSTPQESYCTAHPDEVDGDYCCELNCPGTCGGEGACTCEYGQPHCGCENWCARSCYTGGFEDLCNCVTDDDCPVGLACKSIAVHQGIYRDVCALP